MSIVVYCKLLATRLGYLIRSLASTLHFLLDIVWPSPRYNRLPVTTDNASCGIATRSRCARVRGQVQVQVQYRGLIICIFLHFAYLVALLEPSSRGSASIVIACAGQMASQSLHAMHRSSPLGYRRSACSPRKRGESGACNKSSNNIERVG